MDEKLSVALAEYGHRRRSIGREMSRSAAGLPYHGGRDMLLWIARLEQPNVTALAKALGITRGGASKGVAKLTRAGLVESYKLPENRKEVYLRLTAQGEATATHLRQMMDSLHCLEMDYLAGLGAAQKEMVLDFFEGFTRHLAAWERETIGEEAAHAQNA